MQEGHRKPAPLGSKTLIWHTVIGSQTVRRLRAQRSGKGVIFFHTYPRVGKGTEEVQGGR